MARRQYIRTLSESNRSQFIQCLKDRPVIEIADELQWLAAERSSLEAGRVRDFDTDVLLPSAN